MTKLLSNWGLNKKDVFISFIWIDNHKNGVPK